MSEKINLHKGSKINKETGEITPNVHQIKKIKRKNGTTRIIQDFSECVSLTEMHGSHSNDPNYLVERYAPDDLSLYLRAREAQNFMINGHDFTREPDAQEAMNEVYRLKQSFLKLPEKTQKLFDRDFVKFMKFIDDPKTTLDELVELGLATPKEKEKPTPPTKEPVKEEK